MIVRFVNILHIQVYDFSYVDMESMPDVWKMKRQKLYVVLKQKIREFSFGMKFVQNRAVEREKTENNKE